MIDAIYIDLPLCSPGQRLLSWFHLRQTEGEPLEASRARAMAEFGWDRAMFDRATKEIAEAVLAETEGQR